MKALSYIHPAFSRLVPVCTGLVWACLFFALSAQAQQREIKVSANVVSDRVAVGEPGQFVITITNQDGDVPNRIEAAGLDIVKSGSHFSMTAGGGGQSAEYSHFYRFHGETPGKYTIPSVPVTIRGQVVTTHPVEVEIYLPDSREEPGAATRPYFGKLELTKNEFYVHELVPFTLTAYVRGRNAISDIVHPKLASDNFVIKSFRELRQDGGMMGSTYYTTAVIPSHLFALKPGEHQLGPARIGARIVDSTSQGGFSAFFPRLSTKEFETNSVLVKVKPLPEGAPASFTGGVGTFDFQVSASRSEAHVGDPVTLEITVTGVGNLSTLGAPVFGAAHRETWSTREPAKNLNDVDDSDGFKKGTATFSQVLIPEKRTTEIPALELTYFDPVSEQYVTKTSDPIPVIIHEDPAPANRSVAPGADFSAASPDSPPAVAPHPQYSDILHPVTTTPRWVAAGDIRKTGLPWLLVQAVFSLAFCTITAFGLIRWHSRWRLHRAASHSSSFARAMRQIPRFGSARGPLLKSVTRALDLWKKEHAQADSKVREIADRLVIRCESHLYSGDHQPEVPLPPEEETEIRNILNKLSRR